MCFVVRLLADVDYTCFVVRIQAGEEHTWCKVSVQLGENHTCFVVSVHCMTLMPPALTTLSPGRVKQAAATLC